MLLNIFVEASKQHLKVSHRYHKHPQTQESKQQLDFFRSCYEVTDRFQWLKTENWRLKVRGLIRGCSETVLRRSGIGDPKEMIKTGFSRSIKGAPGPKNTIHSNTFKSWTDRTLGHSTNSKQRTPFDNTSSPIIIPYKQQFLCKVTIVKLNSEMDMRHEEFR